MLRPDTVKTHPASTLARTFIVAVVVLSFGGAVTGCGQRGPLYYPDKDNPDRRR